MTTHKHADAFARYLGIAVASSADGHAIASLTVNRDHLNPHATAHGALLYSVIGAALAAAANNATHSGVVSAVQIDYLSPAREGDRLVAIASVAERLAREDIFVVRLTKADDDTVIARASGRATRRSKTADSSVNSTPSSAGS
jgi:acyl-CoA thioesterase